MKTMMFILQNTGQIISFERQLIDEVTNINKHIGNNNNDNIKYP